MTTITVRVTIQGANDLEKTYVHEAHVEDCTEDGADRFASELFEYVGAELTWHQYRAEFGPLESLVSISEQLPATADIFALADAINRQELWREIQNTLYDVVHSLALAKAYRVVEPQGPPQQWFSAHSRKLSLLNIAALYLAKIHDLVVRLLFESFGGNEFILVDTSDEEWEKRLTMWEAKRSLARLASESRLDASEYDALMDAIQEPTRCADQSVVIDYRNRVAHRVRPSVDHWETRTAFQNRAGTPIYGHDGAPEGMSWAIGAHSKEPEFHFERLYGAMQNYLLHVNTMLTKLKAMPRLT